MNNLSWVLKMVFLKSIISFQNNLILPEKPKERDFQEIWHWNFLNNLKCPTYVNSCFYTRENIMIIFKNKIPYLTIKD